MARRKSKRKTKKKMKGGMTIEDESGTPLEDISSPSEETIKTIDSPSSESKSNNNSSRVLNVLDSIGRTTGSITEGVGNVFGKVTSGVGEVASKSASGLGTGVGHIAEGIGITSKEVLTKSGLTLSDTLDIYRSSAKHLSKKIERTSLRQNSKFKKLEEIGEETLTNAKEKREEFKEKYKNTDDALTKSVSLLSMSIINYMIIKIIDNPEKYNKEYNKVLVCLDNLYNVCFTGSSDSCKNIRILFDRLHEPSFWTRIRGNKYDFKHLCNELQIDETSEESDSQMTGGCLPCAAAAGPPGIAVAAVGTVGYAMYKKRKGRVSKKSRKFKKKSKKRSRKKKVTI